MRVISGEVVGGLMSGICRFGHITDWGGAPLPLGKGEEMCSPRVFGGVGRGMHVSSLGEKGGKYGTEQL